MLAHTCPQHSTACHAFSSMQQQDAPGMQIYSRITLDFWAFFCYDKGLQIRLRFMQPNPGPINQAAFDCTAAGVLLLSVLTVL